MTMSSLISDVTELAHGLEGHVAVVGIMGAGKSTVGALVADRVGAPMWDSDAWIERETGTTGRLYAEAHGVPALHELESRMLVAALESSPPAVITPAASVFDVAKLRDRLRDEAYVVYLELDPDIATARILPRSHRRDMTASELADTFARRRPHFVAAARIVVDATSTPQELADLIVTTLETNRTNRIDL